jgi:hypothetical protein
LKVLIDMNLSPEWVEVLRRACIPSTHWSSVGRPDATDDQDSQGLRLLRGVGALKEVSAPTDRVERFEPDIELRNLILHYLEQRVEKQLNSGKQRIRDIKASIPRSEPAAAKLLVARVKSLEGWHKKSRAILPLFKGALKLTVG